MRTKEVLHQPDGAEPYLADWVNKGIERVPGARSRRAAALLALGVRVWSLPAPATVPLDGDFMATRDCPATISIKHRDSAGGVALEPGRGYRVLGKNKPDATHYQVAIEGARPAERWVEVGCGTLAARGGGHSGDSGDGSDRAPSGEAAETQATTKATDAATRPGRSRPGAFILALSWQPAFCEVNRRKAECRDQTAERPDASRFSLHGLSPQPREATYCGVDARTRRLNQAGDWSTLPDLNLRPATRERLATLMPGSRSGLERHEWYSHGSCYGTDADIYFTHATALIEQVNAAHIGALFAEKRGRHLSSNQIRAAFNRDFGRGAGERVRLVCEDGMISELRISLRGEISDASRIGTLI